MHKIQWVIKCSAKQGCALTSAYDLGHMLMLMYLYKASARFSYITCFMSRDIFNRVPSFM